MSNKKFTLCADDAMLEIEGTNNRFGPSSGIAAAYIMWYLSACIVEELMRLKLNQPFSRVLTVQIAGKNITHGGTLSKEWVLT